MVLEMPFSYLEKHEKFANEYIHNVLESDKSFDDLSDDKKKEVSEYADAKSVEYLMNLETEEAANKLKEIAGSFAVLIQRYVRMVQEKLKSNQKLLFILGSHTGMIEPFLAEVAIWRDKEGNVRHGATLEEIGGNFNPSEGFDIILKTNQKGGLEDIEMHFDNPARLGNGVAYLNMEKINEVAKFYKWAQEIDNEL